MENETPSQEVVNASNATYSITDARNRKITIRKLRSIDRMKLYELIGGENSSNEPYLGIAALAFSVVRIDEDDKPRPGTRLQLEALVKELDDEGIDAITKLFVEKFGTKQNTVDEIRDAVKNG